MVQAGHGGGGNLALEAKVLSFLTNPEILDAAGKSVADELIDDAILSMC